MKISEYKVMYSAAGYYIGRSYLDEQFNADLPYDRSSDYYKSREDAQRYLDYLLKHDMI